MTQTPYRPTAPPRTVTALKVVAAVGLVLCGLAAAGITALIGWIVYTGCLLGCGEPQQVEGLLLGALAVVLLVAGPVLARLMWRRTTTVRGATTWAVLLVAVPGGYLLLQVLPQLAPQL